LFEGGTSIQRVNRNATKGMKGFFVYFIDTRKSFCSIKDGKIKGA